MNQKNRQGEKGDGHGDQFLCFCEKNLFFHASSLGFWGGRRTRRETQVKRAFSRALKL